MNLLILGGSKHQGEFEGRAYDFSKIFTIAPMEQSSEKLGSAGVDMRGTPEVFNQLAGIDFSQPVKCEVQTELRAMGGGKAQETVVSVRPIK